MSQPIIAVEELGKKYVLSHRQESKARYESLRETLMNGLRSVGRRLRRPTTMVERSAQEEFWALRDVSFEVQPGEVVGIIGRNGAGKSTLLKILSRITEPTTGQVTLRGRVASLLEVGTGFHPELTGRENVYLNGTILGMSRAEIRRNFDEIVAFAEVEKFLDTPVKRYSSGMYMRLAFAVAAHLEPEILVVDEVLAVGDAQFQQKCLGKMREVARCGRTVLFVSHNMGAVNRLCSRAVWLQEGRMSRIGATETIVTDYLLGGAEQSGERRWETNQRPPGNDRVKLRAVRVISANGEIRQTVDVRRPFWVEMEVEIVAPVPSFRSSIRVLTGDGITVFTSTDQENQSHPDGFNIPGRYLSRCGIPGNLLNIGHYFISPGADIPFVEVIFFEEQCLGFHVEQTGGVSGKYPELWPGLICPCVLWESELVSENTSQR